jgi:hypothetical protein
MARDKTETSRFRTDQEKFNDNYNHVFNKKECKCEECLEPQEKSCKDQNPTKTVEG